MASWTRSWPCRFAVAALLLVVAGSVLAQDQTQTRFDGILSAFQAQAEGWQGVLTASAEWLFFTLAIISFLWANMNLALRGGDVSNFIQVNTQEILRIGIMWVLLKNAYDWSTAIVMGFRQAGERAVIASGGAGAEPTLDPAGIFQNGMIVAGSLFSQMSIWSGPDNLALVICALVMIFCFAFLAAFMAVAIVESYIVIGGAVLFLGFGGSPWTGEIAKRTLMYCVSVGAKLFALQLIVGVAMGSVITWSQTYESDSSTSTLGLIGLILVITIMAKMIPELVQGMLNGASVGGAGTMLATGAAAVAAAVAGTSALMSGGGTAAAQAGAGAAGAATTGAQGAAAFGGAAGGFSGVAGAASQAGAAADAALGPMGNMARSAMASASAPGSATPLGGASEAGGAGVPGATGADQAAYAPASEGRAGGQSSTGSNESASAFASRAGSRSTAGASTGAGGLGASPSATVGGAAAPSMGASAGVSAPGSAPMSEAPASDPGAALGAQTAGEAAGSPAGAAAGEQAGDAASVGSATEGSIGRAEAAPESGKPAAFSEASSKGAQALGHIVDTATGYNPGGAIAPELAGLGESASGERAEDAETGDGGTIRGDDSDARSRTENAKRGAAAGFAVAGPGGAAIGAAIGAAAGPKIDATAARARAALTKAKNLTGNKPNDTPKE